MARRPLSLKARAIGLLSRREHSRTELARKLAPHCEDPAELESLLNELEAGDWLSQQRFAESLVHRRAPKLGTRRVLQELRQHGLPEGVVSEAADSLRETEMQRAREVWHKRFGVAPADTTEYARQYRYMAARGFPSSCLRAILADLGSDPALEPAMPDDSF